MEQLIIHINNKEFKAKFDKNSDSTIFINEKPYKVELLKQFSKNIFSFSLNNRLLQVELELNDNGNSLISADGFTHEIEITDETKKLLKKYLAQSESQDSHKNAIVKAPMPGMVVKIPFKIGDTVQKGEKIIILEAMKMENAIASPITGVIKSIKVTEGTAVEKDAPMIEIEKPENMNQN